MDVLLQANESENPKNKMSKDELVSTMRTVIAAAHETTASALHMMIYELAGHPDVQEKVRAEVQAMVGVVNARGDYEYSVADLEGMQYVQAVLKEILRLHPSVPSFLLVAMEDDVIPLSKPTLTTRGESISSIPVRTGQHVSVSLAGYNRLKEVWGPDAHEFRPERWLNGQPHKTDATFGVYSKMATFAGGAVSCLGWRFATLEILTFMVEIVLQFRFAYPKGGPRVLLAPGSVTIPVLEGELERGMQLRVVLSPIEAPE